MNLLVIGERTFPTMLAITPMEQAQGLMYVKANPPIMSFVYDEPEMNKIWMKNTFVPLDVIFCRAGKIVAISRGEPHSEDLFGPDYPTDLIVEMPEGSVEKYDICIGNEVRLKYDVASFGKKLSARYLLT